MRRSDILEGNGVFVGNERKWDVCWKRKEGREEEGDDLGIYRGIESENGRSIAKEQ